jgi:ectoine hydroxylase-related dioxygenase (phytanoyl-CoA dioxygenase family)
MLPDAGFTIIRGPFEADALVGVIAAFDRAVATAPASHCKAGSTSIRVNAVLDRAPELAAIIAHPPLLEAAATLIGGPFKLSSFHARSIMPGAAAQDLHQDVAPGADGWPLLGFIFMLDAFEAANGATRFLPGSAGLTRLPEDDICVELAQGPRGSLLLYDGSTWHGHGENSTTRWRRSVQGAFIPKSAIAAVDHRRGLRSRILSSLPGQASPAHRKLKSGSDGSRHLK